MFPSTKYLIRKTITKKKYITDRLLSDYLSVNVAKYVKDNLNHNQNPKSILDSNSENVVVEIDND